MEHSMFFDSSTDDKRKYTSEHFSDFMATFYSNGVLNGGNRLQVTRGQSGLSVNLSPGYAMINGRWYHNDSAFSLLVSGADASMPRIDRVVLRLDLTIPSRKITALVLAGTPAANPVPPALVRNDNYYDLSLAKILIPINATNVGTVTDERGDSNVCGLCNGLFTVDMQAFEARLDALITEMEGEAQDAVNAISTLSNATLLQKIKEVDGSSSGIDSDLLDGQHGTYYSNYNNLSNKPTITSLGGQRQILSGTAAPSSSLGQNGDVYIQYS